MFLHQFQPQIHRVIVLYAAVCVTLDIFGLVLAGNISCYNVVDPGLQAAMCITPDGAILVTYFLTSKADRYVTKNRTRADWNKPVKDVSFRSMYLVCQVLMILFPMFWPFYEIMTTAQIQQPIQPNCQVYSTAADGLQTRMYPLMLTLIRYLHMIRIRNALALVNCILVAFDLRISVGRWRRVRKQKRRARLGQEELEEEGRAELWAKAA